jgi:lysophospholipase L1-like esterase
VALDAAPILIPPTALIERTDFYGEYRLQQITAQLGAGPQNVVFFGDSLLDGFRFTGADAWSHTIAPFGAENFGIASDSTATLLWRLAAANELFDQPKVAVVEIGTNNLLFDVDGAPLPDTYSAQAVSEAVTGITAVVATMRALSPQTKILLLGLMPVGESPTDPLRGEVANVNGRIAQLADRQHVWYLDGSQVVLQPDGARDMTEGGIHLTSQEYEAWAALIQNTLGQMLGSAAPPTVANVGVDRVGGRVKDIRLTFNEAMDPNSTANPGNYTLLQLAPRPNPVGTSFASAVRNVVAQYDPVHWTVTLNLPRSTPPNAHYVLIANGLGPSAITSASGVALAGPADQPGTNYQTSI